VGGCILFIYSLKFFSLSYKIISFAIWKTYNQITYDPNITIKNNIPKVMAILENHVDMQIAIFNKFIGSQDYHHKY